MRTKTTRAFRTISEAGEELGLQPHVLRFWESKFTDIKPMKRGGGRRFYRPEDIEFIRGIKTLLYDEKHPIKDVQKLIAKSGASRVVELGRSVEQASRDRSLSDMPLVPKRLRETGQKADAKEPVAPLPASNEDADPVELVVPSVGSSKPVADTRSPDVRLQEPPVDRERLRAALDSLESLKRRWQRFEESA
ncbi:MAG: MerR family transcriptional regulator [Litorimonas sp.]